MSSFPWCSLAAIFVPKVLDCVRLYKCVPKQIPDTRIIGGWYIKPTCCSTHQRNNNRVGSDNPKTWVMASHASTSQACDREMEVSMTDTWGSPSRHNVVRFARATYQIVGSSHHVFASYFISKHHRSHAGELVLLHYSNPATIGTTSSTQWLATSQLINYSLLAPGMSIAFKQRFCWSWRCLIQ